MTTQDKMREVLKSELGIDFDVYKLPDILPIVLKSDGQGRPTDLITIYFRPNKLIAAITKIIEEEKVK